MNSKCLTTLVAPLLALLLAGLACNLPSASPGETPTPGAAAPTITSQAQAPTQPPPAPPSPAAVVSDTPSAPPAGTTAPAGAPAQEARFAVMLVAEGDVLNVRAGPGARNDIVATLPPHAAGITQTDNHERVGDSTWVEIVLPNGSTGWVNGRFLTVQVPAPEFCNDGRVQDLIDGFVAAIQAQDGDALLQLVSPKTGLIVRHEWWNPEVAFVAPQELANLFTGAAVRSWGVQDGSGQPIEGSFREVVLPLLRDVIDADFSRHCNTLDTGVASGATAGIAQWPFEYANVNYLALYRAAPTGDEFNWRTWAVGIEYLRGQPLIAFLVQYHWEI